MTTSSPIEIRPVTVDDLAVLIDIYLDSARHHAAIDPEVFRVPDRDDVAERLLRRINGRDETFEYVAAIVDGRMAGSATIGIDDLPHPGAMARPVRSAEFGVSVVEGFRGKGIGTALIRHLEEWAAARGVERIVLNVSEANVDAIRLYHAIGYRDYDRAMLKRLTGT